MDLFVGGTLTCICIWWIPHYAVFIDALIVILSMDRYKLSCSSVNLLEAIENPTPFCIIGGKEGSHDDVDVYSLYMCIFIGALYYYAFSNLTLWWFLHVCYFTYEVNFPFHARRMRALGRTKYIAATLLVLGTCIHAIRYYNMFAYRSQRICNSSAWSSIDPFIIQRTKLPYHSIPSNDMHTWWTDMVLHILLYEYCHGVHLHILASVSYVGNSYGMLHYEKVPLNVIIISHYSGTNLKVKDLFI